jgi:prepilin-type N-terminal cleavage/methylation domain-containing protein
MNKKKFSNYLGFTLIELMLVIVIITVLTSFVLLVVDVTRKKTRDAIIISSLEQLQAIAETVYNPNDGYKEFYDMRESNYSKIEDIRKKIKDMGGSGFNFEIKFPEDISGEVGFYEYCAWVKLAHQPKNGSARNFCVDSKGTAKVVEWEYGVTEYNCRVDELPYNCDYR